jgi:hypothetical protein
VHPLYQSSLFCSIVGVPCRIGGHSSGDAHGFGCSGGRLGFSSVPLSGWSLLALLPETWSLPPRTSTRGSPTSPQGKPVLLSRTRYRVTAAFRRCTSLVVLMLLSGQCFTVHIRSQPPLHQPVGHRLPSWVVEDVVPDPRLNLSKNSDGAEVMSSDVPCPVLLRNHRSAILAVRLRAVRHQHRVGVRKVSPNSMSCCIVIVRLRLDPFVSEYSHDEHIAKKDVPTTSCPIVLSYLDGVAKAIIAMMDTALLGPASAF